MKDLHAVAQHDAVEPLDQVALLVASCIENQAVRMDEDTDRVN